MSVITTSLWHQTLPETWQRETRAALSRLKALMLLSGSVRTTRFMSAIQRQPLDLPVNDSMSLLDLWRRHVQELAQAIDWDSPRICILSTRNGRSPAIDQRSEDVLVTLKADRDDFRGTGGVLRDATEAFDPDDRILVAHAAKILRLPLADLAQQLADKGGDVALVAHADGQPSSLSLIRCGCLQSVPRVGYFDLKEQALPRIAADHTVTVLRKQEAIAMPVRDMHDYLDGLRWYHQSQRPMEERGGDSGQPAFAIVESGADVHPNARIVDSVVLRGARVETGAIIARSVVCPGAVVRRDAVVVDQLITPSSRT